MYFKSLGISWKLVCVLGLLIGPAAALSQEPVIVVGDPVQMTVEEPSTPEPTPFPVNRKPRVSDMTCNPPVSAVGPYGRQVVESRVIVVDPDERLWCPDIEWIINDEPQSKREVLKCNQSLDEARAEAERGEIRYSIVWRWSLEGGGYSYKIRLLLKKNGKTVLFRDCNVSVK